MDTTKPSEFSTSPSELALQLLGDSAPLVIDVRKRDAFYNSEYILTGALRRDPLEVKEWANDLPKTPTVLVYCVHGHEVSQNVTQALRQIGINAKFLQHGIEGWNALGLPIYRKASGQSSLWVTRTRPKIDRIACPWLIRRFIDEDAAFLYVPVEHVKQVAIDQNAVPYDVSPSVAKSLFTHAGELCSFDAFIINYRLDRDPSMVRLATIVRAADTDTLNLSPEAAGLLAVSLGMSRLHQDDHAMLEAMMPVYDALYVWCKDKEAGQAEQHNWKSV